MGTLVSGAEPRNIPEKLKNEIRNTLSRFFTKSYGDEVRNPVLFLNFLYQHSLITKPEYDIRPDPKKTFYFNCTCSLSPLNFEDRIATGAVGPWKVEVEASSKKECKKRAAQKFLNLFLADEKMDVVNYCDNQGYPVELGIKSMSIGSSDSVKTVEDRPSNEYETEPTEDTEKFYEDDLTGMYSFDAVDVFNSTELHQNGKYKLKNRSSIRDLEPQCDSSSVLVLEPQCAAPKLLEQAAKYEKRSRKPKKKKKKNRESVPSTSSLYPVFHVKSDESLSFSDAVSQGTESSRLSDVISQNDLNSTDKSSLSISSNSSSQISDDLKASQVIFGMDFFDPFSKVRPRFKDDPLSSRKETGANVEKENLSEKEVSSGETERKLPFEFGQNNKTPFQILQEKAVKNLKLIPRSRIEQKNDGFSCTLVLDTNIGYGEGRTKKEAKLKAATSLLQILGNV